MASQGVDNHGLQNSIEATQVKRTPQVGINVWEPRRTKNRKRSMFLFISLPVWLVIIFMSIQFGATIDPNNGRLKVYIGDQPETQIDLRQSIPVSPYLSGVNIFPQKNSSSDDSRFSGFMEETPNITTGIKDMHIKLLRYPGGTWGEDHILSLNQLADFARTLNATNTDGMISVHLGGLITNANGQGAPATLGMDLASRVTLAAEWVDYMNNARSLLRTGAHAHDPFHPVPFWSIGNEPDISINPETGKVYTVAEYTQAFIQFSLKMHEADPKIKIFGPEISQFAGLGSGPFDANKQAWMESFLKGIAQYEQQHPNNNFKILDGVSFHIYPFNNAQQAGPLLLSSAGEWNYLLPPLKTLIAQEFGQNLPIAITEINTNPGTETPTTGNAALWWADTLGALMQQQVPYVAFFSASGVNKPYPLFTSDGLHETAMARVMEIFAHQQNNFIPLTRQDTEISTYITQDRTHKIVSFLFINKSATTQVAQIEPDNTFLQFSQWQSQDVTLASDSIVLLTLHQEGGANAYSYQVPTTASNGLESVKYTTCGHKTDALDNSTPC